jgi:hypothetical protein
MGAFSLSKKNLNGNNPAFMQQLVDAIEAFRPVHENFLK